MKNETHNPIKHYSYSIKPLIFRFLMMLVLTTGIAAFSPSASYAQSAVARLHFESAEKAYNAGNYKEVLAKLDETEKLTGPTSKTLYLRVAAQDKLLQKSGVYTDAKSFELLTDLRENVATYLEVMANYGLDDRYREVYAISEQLSAIPKTKGEWKEVQQKKETEAQALKEKTMATESARLKTEELGLYEAQKITAKDVKHLDLAQFLDHDPPDEACATLIVFRKPKMTSLIVKMPIIVNDNLVHKLRSKHYTVIKLSPGILKLNRSPHYIEYLKNKVAEKPKKLVSKYYDLVSLTMVVEAGKSYYIEADYVDTEVGFTLVGKSVADPFLEEFTFQKIEK